MKIRLAKSTDKEAIRQLHLMAFNETESAAASQLATELLEEKTTPATIAFVAESQDAIIGHVAFSPVTIENDENLQAYILAPLAVRPGFQNRQTGSKLIKTGIDWLKANNVDFLCVYGDPAFYGRFGFKQELAEYFTPPYPLEYPFGWLAMHLSESGLPRSKTTIKCVAALSRPQLW